MTRTRRMKYNDDGSQDTDDSSAENIIPSVSKVNSPIPLNLAFDIVKPNPKDSCSVGDNYVKTGCSIEDKVVSREKEVAKIELEIRELQLRRRLLDLTPNSLNKVRRLRETTDLSGSRPEDETPVVTTSHRYTNVLSSDEMQFKAQIDSVKALCMSVSLPKIEIMKFDGSPLKFWTFMKGFKVNIADRVNDDTQKLMYLIHYCEGIAKDAIEHCVLLPEKEGYTEAIKILHEQFGRPRDIVEAFLKELSSGSSLNQEDEDGPTPPFPLTTVVPENSSNRLLPFIDDPSLCLKHSPDVAPLVDDDDVRSLIVAAAAVETDVYRVHQGSPSVRSFGFNTPPDSRSNRLIDTFDYVSKTTDENLTDLEQIISLPTVDDEYLLKTANDLHVNTVVNIDLGCISLPDKIPTDSGELMSSKTSVMCSAETDLPGVSDVNDNAKSVILLYESSISVKATTTQFSTNMKLVSPVLASAESSIDIKCETESQKDDCFIQSADDDKEFKTTTSVSPLVGLEKEIHHLLPDFQDSRLAKEITHRNIKWHHNTPYASHHRVWGKLVGSIRRRLSALSMSYETLTICLTEVERIFNDRPLLQTRTKWTQKRRDLQVHLYL
ncbi:unnamed protein product [Schistosoma margrebowiei]|uniref:Uncharacterized protein n=1 Tax=Schistosoma margrebowiei TaxID=48269 RepID=A0A183NBW4_9TREM|nr:unnamed protein product [Schistosoma margrebowiei]